MLLRRCGEGSGDDISDVSITLDSLISSADEKNSQFNCHNTMVQQLTSHCDDDDDDDLNVSGANLPSRPISGHGTEEGVVLPTEVSFMWKPLRTTDEDQTNVVQNCLNSDEYRSCENEQSYNRFKSSFSSVNSEQFSQPTANRSLEDETRVSNEQPRHKVEKYGLRKRKACGVENTTQSDVTQSTGEEKSTDRVDDGTISDRTKTKRTSTLTQARCLVLNRPICCVCSLSFSSTADWIDHWRRDHIVSDPGPPYLSCQHCPVRFVVPASRIDSDLHVGIQVARWLGHNVRMHDAPIPSNVEKFACSEPGCGFVALTPASYQIHRQKNRHGASGRGMSALVYFEFRCFLCPAADGCPDVFSSRSALREHIVSNHVVVRSDRVPQVLPCPVCRAERPLDGPGDGDRRSLGRFFHAVCRLLHHLVGKHGWSVPDYVRSHPCQFPGCRYVAVARSDLASHSVSHDSSASGRNPSLPCEKCGRLVKFRAMRSHVRLCQVSVEARRTHNCPHCSSRLSSRHSLRYHVKAVHSASAGASSKEFLCSYCTYSCHHKSNLEEHIFHRHGSNVSRRPVVACSLCPFQTIKPAALRRHTSLVHTDAKTCRCPVCDKMFKCQRKYGCGSMAQWLAHFESELGDPGSIPGSCHYSIW